MHEPVPSDPSARRPVFLGVCLMSMAVLVLQIALSRIFSFTIWYHFAYVSISVALLGYGASGSLLSVAPSLARHLPSFALASSASVILTLFLCAWLPFEPFRIRSAPLEQIPLMLAYYLGITAPFFVAGICISAALKRYSRQVGRLYFFDLAGASLGCLIVVFAIEKLGTPGAVVLASGLAGLAAAAFAASGGRALAGAVLAAAACVVALGTFASARLEFRPSPEKFLSGFLGSPAVRIYTQKWTPIFRTDVFGFVDEEASRGASYASWGISRAWVRDHGSRGPKLRGIAHDGDACAVIYNFDGDLSKLEMFDHHVLKTPYLLLDAPEVLVIGAGGGTDILNAVKNGARHVTGIELDPVTVEAVARDHAEFTGHLYERPDVTVVAGEGRSTLRRSDARYDLIPGTTKEQVREALERFPFGDYHITELSAAYRLWPGTGWNVPPGILHAPGSLCTYEPQKASDVYAMYQSVAGDAVLSEELLWRSTPEAERGNHDYLVGLIDWEKNVAPDFKAKHFMAPRPVGQAEEMQAAGFEERWVCYLSRDFSAKEFTVLPGKTVTITDGGAYGLIMMQGHGRMGVWAVETPVLIRYGQLTYDEFFVCESAAKQGVTISNPSRSDPLVMLKHFGPDNPDLEFREAGERGRC